MNRTQRAVKRQLRKTQARLKAAAKRERREAYDDIHRNLWGDNTEMWEKVKRGAAKERQLKEWHRKIMEDLASDNIKEVWTV